MEGVPDHNVWEFSPGSCQGLVWLKCYLPMLPDHEPWLAVPPSPLWPKLVGHVLEVLYHKHFHKVFVALPNFRMGYLGIEVSNKDWVNVIREVDERCRDVISLSHAAWRDVSPNDKPYLLFLFPAGSWGSGGIRTGVHLFSNQRSHKEEFQPSLVLDGNLQH